jgi:hypothetical protein
MPLLDPSLLPWVAVASMVFAGVSALSAWRSSRSAKAQARISQTEFNERHDEIQAYLIEAVTWERQAADDKERLVSFACSYSNVANAPNTIREFQLAVTAVDDKRVATVVILEPFMEGALELDNLQRLSFPLNLGARSTASGWLSFRLPRSLEEKHLSSYQVTAITSSGQAIRLNCYLTRRVQSAAR